MTTDIEVANVAAEVIDFPAGEHIVQWLPDGKFFIRTPISGEDEISGLNNAYLLLDNNSLRLDHFPTDPSCTILYYLTVGILPDGRLSIVKNCDVYKNLNQQPIEELTYIMGYDWQTGEMKQLVKESLPPFGGNSYSWNPDMTKGVQEAGDLLSTILWLTPERAEPMNITIDDNFRHWSLADNYWVMLNRNNQERDIGIAKWPTWSPNGQQIAFFASLDAIGRSGISRATGEYFLYLMNVDTLQPISILDGLRFAHQLEWSPNGEWMAFTAQKDGYCSEYNCLWLFSPRRNYLVQVTDDQTDYFSWSPDGQKLVTTRECINCNIETRELTLANGKFIQLSPCEEFCIKREIVIYNVSKYVEE